MFMSLSGFGQNILFEAALLFLLTSKAKHPRDISVLHDNLIEINLNSPSNYYVMFKRSMNMHTNVVSLFYDIHLG